MLSSQQEGFLRVLSLLEESGCLQHVVLVGSWVEFVYREGGVLADFEPNIRTLDVDFLVRNLRKPTPPASLSSAARERGFFVESDRLHGTTRLLDPSTGLEVEFLIGKMGAGLETSLKTNIGVTAQGLRHTSILLHNSVMVRCLGHDLQVPIPEAYVIHKMVINGQRGAKAAKDADAIVGLWPHLDAVVMGVLMQGVTKAERKKATAFMDGRGLLL